MGALSRGESAEVLHLADGSLLVESYLFGPLHAKQAELSVYLCLESLSEQNTNMVMLRSVTSMY
jgi:hypothetical protein